MSSRGMRPTDAAAFLLLVTAIVIPKLPDPDTECRTCWEAEAPWIVRVRDQFGIGKSTTYAMLSGISTTWQVMMGGPAETWYERHRDDYARTGDTIHLDRMLRHVV